MYIDESEKITKRIKMCDNSTIIISVITWYDKNKITENGEQKKKLNRKKLIKETKQK